MAAHLHWRLNCLASQGSVVLSIGEIELRTAPGGADQANGGTATASVASSWPPEGAFDNNLGSFWTPYTGSNPLPQWIAYQLPAPLEIVQVAIWSRLDYGEDQAPKDFDIQHSDDGAAWTTALEVRNEPAWTLGEQRRYNLPVTGVTLGGKPVKMWNGTALVDPVIKRGPSLLPVT